MTRDGRPRDAHATAATALGLADRRLKRRERIAATIWDNLPFLRLQHVVFAVAPRLATHLDDLARRRDEERRGGAPDGDRDRDC